MVKKKKKSNRKKMSQMLVVIISLHTEWYSQPPSPGWLWKILEDPTPGISPLRDIAPSSSFLQQPSSHSSFPSGMMYIGMILWSFSTSLQLVWRAWIFTFCLLAVFPAPRIWPGTLHNTIGSLGLWVLCLWVLPRGFWKCSEKKNYICLNTLAVIL